MSTLQRLTDRGLVKPPRWLPGNVQYETIMGSVAYGVSSDTSDVDVYGWAIPPKDDIFPHLRGEVLGFGTPRPRFEQYQEHHVQDRDALGGHGRTYDLTIYGIVKFFNLAMENNPNIIDSLFTPVNCVLHCTRVGDIVRENRKLFLHKGAWPKFKNYAYAQLHKLSTKEPQGKRAELVVEHGYDTKFAYHVVRLHPRGRTDPDRGGHRPPEQQRATQGDPAGRMDRGAAAGVVRRKANGPGAGLRREQAPADPR